jgi:hypothetical protein
MKESKDLSRISTLALRQRRQGLVKLLPPVGETLRGSLLERYVTCGNPSCKCARGERHGPVWYLTVTLGPGRTKGGLVGAGQLEQVQRWIQNYRQVREHLERISEINRELLRRTRKANAPRKRQKPSPKR